jgi:hypothetical protein
LAGFWPVSESRETLSNQNTNETRWMMVAAISSAKREPRIDGL